MDCDAAMPVAILECLILVAGYSIIKKIDTRLLTEIVLRRPRQQSRFSVTDYSTKTLAHNKDIWPFHEKIINWLHRRILRMEAIAVENIRVASSG